MARTDILYLLGWCSLVYMIILSLWSIIFLFARQWLFNLHSKWFPLSEEKFNAIHYALIGFFKMMLIMFFLVPYLVLRAY